MTEEFKDLLDDIDYYKKMLSDPDIRIDPYQVKHYADLIIETLKKIKELENHV